MNWKTSMQLGDLTPTQRLELTCRACGHVHYLTAEEVIAGRRARTRLYLDEVERKLRCKARGCGGRVRMAWVRGRDTSAFIGGMA